MKTPTNDWVSLLEVVKLLHHPNFYWGAMNGFSALKYLDIRIDTRDCKCLVNDRHGKPVSLKVLCEGLENPSIANMNSNSAIEIKVLSCPTEDNV